MLAELLSTAVMTKIQKAKVERGVEQYACPEIPSFAPDPGPFG